MATIRTNQDGDSTAKYVCISLYEYHTLVSAILFRHRLQPPPDPACSYLRSTGTIAESSHLTADSCALTPHRLSPLREARASQQMSEPTHVICAPGSYAPPVHTRPARPKTHRPAFSRHAHTPRTYSRTRTLTDCSVNSLTHRPTQLSVLAQTRLPDLYALPVSAASGCAVAARWYW